MKIAFLPPSAKCNFFAFNRIYLNVNYTTTPSYQLRGVLDSELAELRAKLRDVEEALRLSERHAAAGHRAGQALEDAVTPIEILAYLVHLSRLTPHDEQKVIQYMEAAALHASKVAEICHGALNHYREQTGRTKPPTDKLQ